MRKALSILLIVATALSFAACQVTPEAPIVVEKDTERMIERARNGENNALLAELGIPEGRYTFDTTGANGKLRIHIDADILKPDAAAMPIVKVSMGLFSQRQVTSIFNYLFPDEKPKYDFGQVETKADVEQEILWQKKRYEQGEYDGTEEEFLNLIARMEEAYQAAPVSAPEGGLSDGTLTRFESDPGGTARILNVSSDAYFLWISTHTGIEGINGAQLPNLTFRSKDSGRGYSTRNMIRTDGTNLSGIMKENLVLSYGEAKALCDGFFAAAGFPDGAFIAGDSFVIDDTGADEQPGTNYAYRFIYTRAFENIPLFFDRTGLLFNQDEAFELPWGYEYIEFVIDDEGIVSIDWRTPIEIGNVVESAAALKPYAEIMNIFETMMKTSYEGVVLTTFGGKAELDISVERVELCLVRIREQGGAQADGLLVPAWVFSGRNKGTDQNGAVRYLQGASALAGFDPAENAMGEGGGYVSAFDLAPGVREDDTVILLVINAVDGSVIDLNKGY